MDKKVNINYSAPTEDEKQQIEAIRKEYLPKKEPTKFEKLKKINNKVKFIPSAIALTIGIIFTLCFGLGLTMILEWNLTVAGIIVAVISLLPISLAYPIYNHLDKKMRKKYADTILKLSDELLNEEK